MPGCNGTGPDGKGPLTGGGRGYCAKDGQGRTVTAGAGLGRGGRGCARGGGRGAGRGRGGMSAGFGQAGPGQDGAAVVAAVPVVGESLAPEQYLQWLESEMRRTRETLAGEG